jgi:adenosylhomocysteinase
VPTEVENFVATLKLKSMGIEIDTLTKKQVQYLAASEHGT